MVKPIRVVELTVLATVHKSGSDSLGPAAPVDAKALVAAVALLVCLVGRTQVLVIVSKIPAHHNTLMSAPLQAGASVRWRR